MHLSRHLDGCRAIGINSSFIFTFCALLDNHHTTQKPHHHHHHHQIHRPHAIFLLAVVSQTNQGHIAKRKVLPQLLYHTFLEL